MKRLSSIFPSDEKVKKANFTIGVLSNMPRRKPTEMERRLANAKEIVATRDLVRKTLMGLGFAASMGVAGGASYLAFKDKPAEDPVTTDDDFKVLPPDNDDDFKILPPTDKPDYDFVSAAELSVQTDSLVRVIERSAPEFSRMMTLKTARLHNPPFERQLLLPFLIIDRNMGNLNKNKIDTSEGVAIPPKATIHLNSQNHYSFAYRSTGQKQAIQAADYSPFSREVTLAPNFKADNFLDMFMLYQAMRRMIEDTDVREGMRYDADLREYVNLFGQIPHQKPKKYLVDEGIAFTYTIEAMNLYLGGELKHAARERKQLDPAVILTMLNGRKEQLPLVKMILNISESYFTTGSNAVIQTRPYMESIKNGYKSVYGDAFDFYMKANPDNLVKME